MVSAPMREILRDEMDKRRLRFTPIEWPNVRAHDGNAIRSPASDSRIGREGYRSYRTGIRLARPTSRT
jgi:hypothetical protein